MRGFSKAARTVLALVLALCMVLSVVSVSADETTSAGFVAAAAARLEDGYYSVSGTVSGIIGEYATILVYSGDAPANETIKYANQAAVTSGAATFNMEVPHGDYTVKAGGSGVTAATGSISANTAPVFNNVSGSVDLKTAAVDDVVVAAFGATDVDGDELTYKITAGDDNGYFKVDGSALKIAALPAVGNYSLTVQAADGYQGTATATVSVTVTDSTPLITGYVNPDNKNITDAETFTVPTTVTAHISGAEDVELNATFTSVPGYVAGQEGTYSFTGAVNTEGYKVAEGVAAPTFTLTVSKSATVITSFKPIEAITAKVGTAQADLGLPAEITGLDAAGTEYKFAATWSGDYNADVAAAYTFTAAYELGNGFVAGEGLAAPTISVTVNKYAITSIDTTVLYISADDDYASLALPKTVKAAYDGGIIEVSVTWPEEAEGWQNGIEGTVAISEADAAKVENKDNLKAKAEFKIISDVVAITANGMSGEGVITLTGTDTNFEAVYTAAEGAVVKYAFVVTNVGETASSDNALWQDGATFAYGKDRADETVEIITVFVKVNDKVVGSASIRDYKAKAMGVGYVYVNSNKEGHSALRINAKEGLKVTTDFKNYNDADYAFSGTWEAKISNGSAEATVPFVSNVKGVATFELGADALADFADRSKASRVTVTYSDDTVGSLIFSRVVNVSDIGLWYSSFAVNDNYGSVIMSSKRDNNIKFTLDTLDGNDTVYTGYKFENYQSPVSDGVELNANGITSEFKVDANAIANGTYTLYALANKSENQSYYDFTIGKTVYVQDSVTSVCNIKIDGSTYCVVGGSEAHDFVLAPHWGGSLMMSGVTYEYKFYDLDGTELNIETEKLHDGSVKISAAASESLKFKTRVSLKVLVDGVEDKIIEKIIYVPWGIK